MTEGLFPWDDLAFECREDPGIWMFVARESTNLSEVRQLADWPSVLAESRPDRAFAEATALKSYATYATLANASLQIAAELAELADMLSWRSLYRFISGLPAIGLLAVTVAVAVLLGDYLALACQVVAILLAPAAGLMWRSASFRATLGRVLWRLLAALAFLGGMAALALPMVYGIASTYWSAVLIVIYTGLAGIFATDHARSSLLRGTKTALLLRRGYGLARQASIAREQWLDEARDKAVSHELTQAINRLRAPEHEMRLFVQSSAGLRAVYHEDSQVRTSATQRAEIALDRSDGAAIAIAGPRGSGKSNLLTELCRSDSRFSVLVSAPTQYSPREFLLQLFQELCLTYIRDQVGADAQEPGHTRTLMRFARDNVAVLLRLAAAIGLAALLAWDLASRTAAGDVDRFPREMWADKTVFYAVALSVLIVIAFPKRLRLGWREARLITVARRYLTELRVEQTATSQVQSTIAMVQATYSRASRTLPWTMPELVGRLREFLAQIADAELRGRGRRVLVCIDEVDRIGSADEAIRFLSEVKAIFGAPHCFFAVAIADELGVQLGKRAIAGRPLSDNAFDEIISVEPMTFEMCRDLLTRRVLGFTESFVWLSLVMSGGLPRDVIRVARRLVEMTIESEYELRLAGCAAQLVREEVYEIAVASRSQDTELLAGGRWTAVLETLRVQIRDFEAGRSPGDPLTSLRELADLPDALDSSATTDSRMLAARLAALALLGLTTCEAFSDRCFDITVLRDPATGVSEQYDDLAAARRELGVSAEGCRSAVEQVRKALRLELSQAPGTAM